MIHELKCWPEAFEAVLDGRKPYEWRKYDRPFLVGDTLLLREFLPDTQSYTGREIQKNVSFITAGCFGMPIGWCVLGLTS